MNQRCAHAVGFIAVGTGAIMSKCETCGNDYERAFQVVMDGQSHTFDSFECAIHALAPKCAHCGCSVIGHGVQAGDSSTAAPLRTTFRRGDGGPLARDEELPKAFLKRRLTPQEASPPKRLILRHLKETGVATKLTKTQSAVMNWMDRAGRRTTPMATGWRSTASESAHGDDDLARTSRYGSNGKA